MPPADAGKDKKKKGPQASHRGMQKQNSFMKAAQNAKNGKRFDSLNKKKEYKINGPSMLEKYINMHSPREELSAQGIPFNPSSERRTDMPMNIIT